jgi:hypothetical protein
MYLNVVLFVDTFLDSCIMTIHILAVYITVLLNDCLIIIARCATDIALYLKACYGCNGT